MNKEFARKIVQYIESSNGALEKYASENERLTREIERLQEERQVYQEKLAESIDIMANDGRIPGEYKDAIFNSMKNSPEKVAEFLSKVNDKPELMGHASSEFRSATDPIVEFCFG